MRYLTTALLLLLALLAPAHASGGVLDSGIKFLPACKLFVDPPEKVTAKQIVDATACAAYIRGQQDGHFLGVMLAEGKAVAKKGGKTMNVRQAGLYCTPDEVGIEQLVRVVVVYLETHPEKLHQEPYLLVWNAIREAFPCP